MALSSTSGIRRGADPRKQRISPEASEQHFLKRAAQSQHLHRPLTGSDDIMPKLKSTLSKSGLVTAYGSRQRFVGLTDLKEFSGLTSKQRTQTIFHDKERLYEETLSLKAENNDLKSINTRLGTKMSQLEQELAKKDQLLQQLSGLTEEKQFSAIVAETHLVAGLKQTIRKLKSELQQKDADCELLHKNIRLTKNAELEAEAQEYFTECQRLKELLKDFSTADNSRSRWQRSDSRLMRENQELTFALQETRKDAAGMTARLMELEETIKQTTEKDTKIQRLITDLADCKSVLRSVMQDSEDFKQLFNERTAMLGEDCAGQFAAIAAHTDAKVEDIEAFYKLQIDNLESDKLDLVRVIRETSLRLLKRKVMKKRLDFPSIIPADPEFHVKELKLALRSAGLKVKKWQLTGLEVARTTIIRVDLLRDFDLAPTARDLKSTVMPPSSYNSDTFSLTSNPFEVADTSKHSSGLPTSQSFSDSLHPALSQPTPSLLPVQERDSETQLTPHAPDSSDSQSPASIEEVDEENEDQCYRLALYTEPGGDLMSIAEVRKSLSTDSLDKMEVPSPQRAVILLNIEEDRIQNTLRHLQLRLRLRQVPSTAVPALLFSEENGGYTSIDSLHMRLQEEPFGMRDEAEAMATAGYLVGHRQGLVDIGKQLTASVVDTESFGAWDVPTESQESELRAEYNRLLALLEPSDLTETDSKGRIPLSHLFSLYESKGIVLSALQLAYIELQAYAETKEVDVFPAGKVLKTLFPEVKLRDREKAARECAEHIGTELLVQGLSVASAFDLQDPATPEAFREKVSALGLEDVEGLDELVQSVTGPSGLIDASKVAEYFSQFSLEEED